LPQEHYFAALQDCDFVLSPPGICTPLSHNLIEAIFCGTIPITNGVAFMVQPLENGRNCLEFSGATGFVEAIEQELFMAEQQIAEMRKAVLEYYSLLLCPKRFGKQLRKSTLGRILVNAEEISVPFVYPRFTWPTRNELA
jgi:glycosyltransferase involved in cell wall biosynthesis